MDSQDGRDAGGIELIPAVVFFRGSGAHMRGQRGNVDAQRADDDSRLTARLASGIHGVFHAMTQGIRLRIMNGNDRQLVFQLFANEGGCRFLYFVDAHNVNDLDRNPFDRELFGRLE